jgi:hypothetical protein
MEDARHFAVEGYKQVLENDPDVCDSKSYPENSDHGEMWSYADTYTPDMLGPDRKAKNGSLLGRSSCDARSSTTDSF